MCRTPQTMTALGQYAGTDRRGRFADQCCGDHNFLKSRRCLLSECQGNEPQQQKDPAQCAGRNSAERTGLLLATGGSMGRLYSGVVDRMGRHAMHSSR